MFSIFKFIKNRSNNVKEKDLIIPSFNSKKVCVMCGGQIKESKIKGVRRTKKQTYNYLKARYLDGQIRCQECMIDWLQSKIDEIK